MLSFPQISGQKHIPQSPLFRDKGSKFKICLQSCIFCKDDSGKSRKGRRSFRVKLSPWRHSPVWTQFWGHGWEYSRSPLTCFSFTLSAARQSYEDKQCRLYEKRFLFVKSAGNLERQNCTFSSSSSIDKLFGRRTRVLSTSRTCREQRLLLLRLCCRLCSVSLWKPDQQKPKDSPTPAFNELALLKPEVKEHMAYSSSACISI